MLWEEILVDRYLTDNEIITTISDIFSISPKDVLVITDISEMKINQYIRILCERLIVKGDFLIKLAIYLRDPVLEQMDKKLFISRFCGKLNCICLLADTNINPYSMLLVRGLDVQQIVHLDSERLDENEEYIVRDFDLYGQNDDC